MIRILILFCFISVRILGQDVTILVDSIKQPVPIVTGDTVEIKTYASRFDPQKALFYSAVIPGFGQAYNKKYWKIPIVYGGLIGFAYGVKWNNDIYQELKKGLYYILETGKTTGPPPYELTEEQYRTNIDNYRRSRDFMYLFLGGMYLLQIIDAHVDAHLKEFDVNPNLQVRIRPSMSMNPMMGNQTGLTLTIRF